MVEGSELEEVKSLFRPSRERMMKRARGQIEHDVGPARIQELVELLDTTNWFYTFQVTVGAAVVQMPAHHYPRKGVVVKALAGNADMVYVGHDGNLTAANGFELDASQSIEIECECTSDIWLLGGAAGQVVCVASV